MAYEPTSWESSKDIATPDDLGSSAAMPPFQPPEAAPNNAIPFRAAPLLRETITLVTDTGDVSDAPAQINWHEIAYRPGIDASRVKVSASDAAEILSDRYSTKSQRAARVTRASLLKLAQLAQVDPRLVTRVSEIEQTYFGAAVHMLTHQKSSVEVQVINEILDEGLAPILHATPVPIAERYLKAMQYRTEGHLGLLMTRLWAADTYGIDLPSSYQAIQKLKYVPKEGGLPTDRY